VDNAANSVFTSMSRSSILGGISHSTWSHTTWTVNSPGSDVMRSGMFGRQGATSLAFITGAASAAPLRRPAKTPIQISDLIKPSLGCRSREGDLIRSQSY